MNVQASSSLSTHETGGESSQFHWDIAVFKASSVRKHPTFGGLTVGIQVEDQIFRVARHALIENAEVFESMFRLLGRDRIADAGGGNAPQGVTEDNPIVLEGYKKRDFTALLKVLYPRFGNIISGNLDLCKDEWVGVLRLSTIWRMTVIREFSIKILSESPSLALTAVEKVTIARENKVAKWLIEGITELVVASEHFLPLDLKRAVGLPTAFEILAIQARFSMLRLFGHRETGGVACALHDFQCSFCNSSVFGDEPFACSCGKVIDASDRKSAFITKSIAKLDADSARGRVGLTFPTTNVGCNACKTQLLSRDGIPCTGCGRECGKGQLFIGTTDEMVEAMVTEAFRDELQGYEYP